MAFIPVSALPTRAAPPSRACASWTCAADPGPSAALSRRSLLTSAAAAAASLLAASALPAPAAALSPGRALEQAFSKVLFPKEGFNAPDTLPASPSVVNKQLLASKDAQAALSKLRSVASSFAQLYATFKADPQAELASSVRKLVSISDLRNALNIVNEAIDEDSQIQTDKVVRGIIQDIGELENATYIKKGGVRTAKKIERTTDWFDKITADFNRLLAFYS